MSATIQPRLVVAARTALERVRENYWRKGERMVPARDTVNIIRDLRVSAGCQESSLPKGMLWLLEEARQQEREPVELFKLMNCLNEVVLAEASQE